MHRLIVFCAVIAILALAPATVFAQATCGDVDQSGGIDIDDVVYLIAYIFSGGPEPCPYQNPSGTLIGHGPCKQPENTKAPSKIPNNQECIEWTYDGQGNLTLYHLNTVFNCCPDEILGDVMIYDGSIVITETETMDSLGCPCLCLYDLEYSLTGIAPQEYTITIDVLYAPPSDEINYTVDLSAHPTGQYCVDRPYYPWDMW